MDDYKLIDIINESIDSGDCSNIIMILNKSYNFSDNIKKLALNICDELIIEKMDDILIS